MAARKKRKIRVVTLGPSRVIFAHFCFGGHSSVIYRCSISARGLWSVKHGNVCVIKSYCHVELVRLLRQMHKEMMTPVHLSVGSLHQHLPADLLQQTHLQIQMLS